MFKSIKHFIHFTSLDVVLGALSFQVYYYYFFYQVFPPIAYISGLFSGIWLVYLLDRKWDVILKQQADERHEFQLKHAPFINLLLGMNCGIGLISAYFLPQEILQMGAILILVIFFYWGFLPLFNARKVYYLKELFTALIYSFGVLLVSWINQPNIHLIYLFGLFSLLVWHHLCLYEVLEKPERSYYFSLLKFIELAWFIFFGIFIFREDVKIWELIPLLITLLIQVIIHYFFHNFKSRFFAELAYLSPLIYFIHEIF